jgi:hypothetical protein
MSTFREWSGSRRSFLKDAAVVSAAVAGGIGFSGRAVAAPVGTSHGKATQLDLGLAPHRNVAGAIVVLSEWGTYVTFPEQIAGTAVIELVGCKARTNSYSTNLGTDGQPYGYFELKPGWIYEIVGSPWLAQVEEQMGVLATQPANGGRSAPQPKRNPLRHFVFTFFDTNYQCIAEGLRTGLRMGRFDAIAAELMARGLVDS